MKREITLNPLVVEGEEVVPNQILASVVPVIKKFPCSHTASIDRYINQLSSISHSERYTAVKALSVFSTPTVFNALCEKIAQSNEDIYVRLEAAAGLARHGREEGWAFIKQCIEAPVLENRLEAVIILGEIQSDISCQLLSNVLRDSRQHADIRAGAAWSLGELRNRSALGVLVESFTAIDKNVRIEAARALAKLASVYKPEVLDSFADDVVLDIFAGSNTTGKAAQSCQRRWVAFEIVKSYFVASALRFLDNANEQSLRSLYRQLNEYEKIERPINLSSGLLEGEVDYQKLLSRKINTEEGTQSASEAMATTRLRHP